MTHTFTVALLITLGFPLLLKRSAFFPQYTTNAVKTAFFLSLFHLVLSLGTEGNTLFNLQWTSFTTMNIPISFRIDLFPSLFLPIAFFVTWAILQFSLWYMSSDQEISLFFTLLLIFLISMTILVTAGSLFTLFLGWEGVGIMSFLLIGWYHGRANAAVAAAMAVLYNRIGDMAFLMALCWFFFNTSSSELNNILLTTPPTSILVAIIIAAASKSAQFSLHPWLASAMEGPTPVSALLHSSTMVVAGIYLLAWIHPLLTTNQTAMTTCLCLGAISTAYAALCALTQNDVKKIIAYSTASQLGLMMVAIGLSLPNLAIFHICTHAFFKAMLFLCSGVLIHNLNDDQDIRKMSGLQRTLPLTTSCLSIGSLALMGTPFLSGFFSKDVIIEAMLLSHVNLAALLLTLIATMFTAVYSMRLIFTVSMGLPRFNPHILVSETHPAILWPLLRLALGSIIMGYLLFSLLFPDYSSTLTMPPYIKLLALLATILAFVAAFFLTKTFWSQPLEKRPTPKFTNPLYLESLLHHSIPHSSLMLAGFVTAHLLDKLILMKFMPKLLEEAQTSPLDTMREIHKGLIKLYLAAFCITPPLILILYYLT